MDVLGSTLVALGPESGGDFVDVNVMSTQHCDSGDTFDVSVVGTEGDTETSACPDGGRATDDGDTFDLNVRGSECSDDHDEWDARLGTQECSNDGDGTRFPPDRTLPRFG